MTLALCLQRTRRDVHACRNFLAIRRSVYKGAAVRRELCLATDGLRHYEQGIDSA